MNDTVDIRELIAAGLADRQRCRLAGIAESDIDMERACHVVGLANRLKDRYGAKAAMRAAFLFWDDLQVGAGETLQ